MGTKSDYKIRIFKNQFNIHTHFNYNMSMNVKSKVSRIDKLRQIMKSRQGLLLTSDLANFNIPRTYLSIMEQTGEIFSDAYPDARAQIAKEVPETIQNLRAQGAIDGG